MTCLKSLVLACSTAFLCTFAIAQGWTEIAPLPDGFVSNHSFGFALDGKGYLVAGESTDGYSDAMYEYDPTIDAWTALADFPGPARGYTIGDDWNGQAWIGFGLGNSGYLNDLWVFDSATGEWTEKASCPCTARTHPAFIAEGDKVFVGLGGSANGDLDDWWEYDMATDTWSQKPDFPSSERHHPYQFGIDGMIYVGFGHNGPNIFNEMYRYEPETEAWTEVATLPAEGRVAGTQFSYAGKGYALSGDGDDHSSMEEGEFWQYDPATDAWYQWPSHPGMSRWAPASFVLNDEVYLINGMSYDPGTFDYMESNWKLPMVPSAVNDVAVTGFLGETAVCAGGETPITVQLTNMGSDAYFAGDAAALTVEMEIDGDVVLASDWSGELATYQSTAFTLGTYTFNTNLSFTLRAVAADENTSNDTLDASVEVSEEATSQWLITLDTDNWGQETGWEVRNEAGEVLASAAPGAYDSQTHYEIPVSIPSMGCHTFALIDTYGDGMNGTSWGGINGACTVQSLDDTGSPLDVFFDYDGTFAFEELSEVVSVNQSVNIAEVHLGQITSVFPNPLTTNTLTVKADEGYTEWHLYNALGAVIDGGIWSGTQQRLNAMNWPSGALVLVVSGPEKRAVHAIFRP